MNTLELNHKVMGLIGNEKIISVHHDTFCSLCQHKIRKDTQVILLIGDSQYKYFLHIDCAVARMNEINNSIFRKDVKVRKKPRKTRKDKKVVQQGPGGHCSFCRKHITAEQTYTTDKKKHLHNDGRNSCVVRYRRVVNTTKHSLGA